MIRFEAFGVRFTLPLLTLLAALLGRFLGARGWGALALGLCIHELAHVAAAKACGVEIREIRLTPFGGSAQMENPYGLGAGRLFCVAAAGPAANLLLAAAVSALAQWGLLDAHRARAVAVPSLLLCAFNLLPALPLDGGRMLFCLLRTPLGERRALKCCVGMAYVLASALAAAAIVLRLKGGRWNLAFLLAAAFIFASGRDEASAMDESRSRRLSELLSGDGGGRPAHLYQLEITTSASAALRLLRPRERAWFVLMQGGRPRGAIDAGSILRALLEGAPPDAPLGELPHIPFSQKG